MPSLFRYRAIEAATGRTRTGESRGDSAFAVRASLRRIGLQVEHLESLDARQPPRWLAPLVRAWNARQCRRRRLAKADLCDGLATLMQAGLPMESAVASLAASAARPVAERRFLAALRDRLREGEAFSEACARFPDWFDALDVALIAAGQHAGELATTLIGLGQYHQRAGALGQKLFVALAYPCLVLLFGLGIVEYVSLKTLPELVKLIAASKQRPPGLTLALIEVGKAVAAWWPVIAGGIVGSVLLVRWGIGLLPLTSRLAGWVHGNALARLRGRARVAQLARVLARLRRAGMPLTEALAVAAETISDRALRRLLAEAVDAIRRGEDLSTVIGKSPLLDPEFAQLLQLGERSGELTEMLERIADRYQRAADRSGERLAALLGPLAIILLAILVGIVVMACALPLVQLGDLV